MAKRKRKRRKKETGSARGPYTGLILLAAAILAGSAYFLADSLGVRYGVLGSLLWLAAFVVTVALVLINYARSVLPVEGDVGWYEGARLLGYYTVYRFPPVIRDFFGPFVGLTDYPDPPEGVPQSFKTVGAGMVDSHLVLVLARGSEFSRAAGPGYVRLNGRERIRDVFDLRPHVRSIDVKGLTRDGIPIETQLTVTFQIRRLGEHQADRNAVFLLSYTGSRSDAEDEIPWTERIAPLAAASLVTHLSNMRLDELYVDENRPAPLEELAGQVGREVYLRLSHIFDYAESDESARPVEILGVSLGLLRPPRDVEEQRVRNWQTPWRSQIYQELVGGSAEARRRINYARARARLELTRNIVESIDTMRQAGYEDLSEIVRLRMLDAMENALGDGNVRAIIPDSVLKTLDEIQGIVDPERRQREKEKRDEAP